ncbi:carboxylating nicotinate-nucleotide diphosphorylase [Gynuella sunshinyii]|nr:carboxylating nicotinate-nucleotide diphosphorylase [Gynuella sunshinyii]
MKIEDVPFFTTLVDHMQRSVAFALEEDIGTGDITAQLIPAEQTVQASIICKDEKAVICGQAWVNEVFRQVDPSVSLNWLVEDGDNISNQQTLVEVSGNARSILTAERTALNYLQTLSGTATTARQYAEAVKNKNITVLDTRKTIPGLRLAQKYAVLVGGCANHRLGLYDMFLIKENHIAAAGGITKAVAQSQQIAPKAKIEIEVENIEEFNEAAATNAHYIMLDEFSEQDVEIVIKTDQRASSHQLEISGGLDLSKVGEHRYEQNIRASVGGMTKEVRVVDLSLRVL